MAKSLTNFNIDLVDKFVNFMANSSYMIYIYYSIFYVFGLNFNYDSYSCNYFFCPVGV